MKKDRDKHQEAPDHTLPPEISPTVPTEISSTVEAMKDAHEVQEEIEKEEWGEQKKAIRKRERSMFKGFSQKLMKGEGPNPILKKGKSIGGVRGKFHPSKKGK
ncbi:MAG: hypothetical protein ACMUIL_01475 [bacterium]